MRHTVKITLTLLGDAAATLLLILLKDLDLLERLHDLTINAAAGIDVLGRTGAAVLGAAVDLAETADTNGLAEVDVAGNGSGADVEPVDVLGGHLLGGAGLDGVNPTYKFTSARYRGYWSSSVNLPGTGSLPWRFRKAAYAATNLWALRQHHN